MSRSRVSLAQVMSLGSISGSKFKALALPLCYVKDAPHLE